MGSLVVSFGEQLGHEALVLGAHKFDLITSNLLGQSESPREFINLRFTSAEHFLRHCRERGNLSEIMVFHIAHGQLLYLYGDSQGAADELEKCESNLEALNYSIEVGRFYFYQALALLDIAAAQETRSSSTRSVAQDEKIEASRARLAIFSESCPENFLHKLLLVDAERARCRGDVGEAMKLYDEAIEEARRQDFVHLEALANERAGRFWMELHKEEFAQEYLEAARYGYQFWGASRKVEMIQKEFGDIIGHEEIDEATTGDATGDRVDVESVFNSSEIIAGQFDTEELLPIMMQVILENAGAQRGTFFSLTNDDQLCVVVDGESKRETRKVEPPVSLGEWENGPRSVLRYVQRTGEPVVLGRASRDPRFRADPYIRDHQVRSVLCIPVSGQDQLRGVLYVENNLGDEAFGEERTRILQILADHIGIALDRAHLYAELRERQERFRQLAENISEVFWLMDVASEEISYVSPAYEKIWNQQAPESPISVDEWVKTVVPDDRERVATTLREQAVTGIYDETYRIERPSGVQRWIRDRGFPIRDEAGRIFRIAGVALDITSEHEVAQLKEEFISVVSHELRTPLTPIMGIFSMLVNKYPDQLPEGIPKMAKLGLRNSRRLVTLIDDLLDIQNLSMGTVRLEREVIELGEVLGDAVHFNKSLGEMRGITLRFIPYEEPILVEADRARLLQVFTNLLSNAVKFSSDGDVVEVSAGRSRQCAKIAVSDKGPGIPRSARAQIFEKFTQADSSLTRRHGGTGLGLAIARTIVERHEGRIYFETEEDRGTTFIVELPLFDPASV